MLIKTLMDKKDFEGIEKALSANPGLANEGLPYDELNAATAHPLHRICDGVFAGKYTDAEAVIIAKIFLAHGADVNGGEKVVKKDTPLIAAASLGAEQVGILYMEKGADIHHAGTHGGTALHWAAWCARHTLVKKLVEAGADINQLCADFTSTPLFWTVHGYVRCGRKNLVQYLDCARLLMEAGADKTIINVEGFTVFDLLAEDDRELKALLNSSL
jgi:uncharacterized protein